MKRNILLGIYFIVALVVFSHIISMFMNQGNEDMTTEMQDATYPVAYFYYNGEKINYIYGYSQTMDCASMREVLTPLGDSREVNIGIDTYGQLIDSIHYEVRSLDGERLIENTELDEYEQEHGSIRAKFHLKDLIEEDHEYMLILVIEKSGEEIRYYSRVIQPTEYHEREKIAFVKEFHNKTFSKTEAEDITMYLESNSEGDNTSLSHVNIHSSFKQVTWGDLMITNHTKPQISIREMHSQTASIHLAYQVEVGNGKNIKHYEVGEYYRIRYTPDRIYLLEYDRSMNQLYDKDNSLASNKIQLGIQEADNLEIAESEGGNIAVYVVGRDLYAYNQDENKLSTLFTFRTENYLDDRCMHNESKIKILDVDETGNVDFMVYGYMNRGRHEGKMGVAIYSYSGTMNSVEEKAFISYHKSYSMLCNQIGRLSYKSKNNLLYILLDGDVYAINLDAASSTLVVGGLEEGFFQISKSGKMIAYQNESNLYHSKSITLLNLNTQKSKEIEAGNGESIVTLGFMGEDVLYGLVKDSDVRKESNGSTIYPMYRLRIQDENGEILKNYEQDGYYITSASTKDNQIILKRVIYQESTDSYEPTYDDQIVNAKEQTKAVNVLEKIVTDEYESIMQIAVSKEVNNKTLKQLTPKEVLFEGERQIVPSSKTTPKHSIYYVYKDNKLLLMDIDAAKAINMAYDLSAVVVNEKGQYVWYKGNRHVKNQIMAIKESAVTEEKSSLVVCLDTILGFNGTPRNTEYLLRDGKDAKTVLAENMDKADILDLTGCNLDAVLYYVNQDIPVLATLNDGNAVLIIGFNELNTVLMDPREGTIYKMGINDSKEFFEQNGNSFITYVKNAE